jgi:hypothetical protein
MRTIYYSLMDMRSSCFAGRITDTMMSLERARRAESWLVSTRQARTRRQPPPDWPEERGSWQTPGSTLTSWTGCVLNTAVIQKHKHRFLFILGFSNSLWFSIIALFRYNDAFFRSSIASLGDRVRCLRSCGRDGCFCSAKHPQEYRQDRQI